MAIRPALHPPIGRWPPVPATTQSKEDDGTMLSYLAQRLASTILVMTLVGIFVFLLLHFSAGDPAAIIAGTTPRRSRSSPFARGSGSTIPCSSSSTLGAARRPG